jgi:uncharacterized Zn finger protein
MTPQEKANELIRKYYSVGAIECKTCALIAVDLHLEELSKMKLIFSDRELHLKHWQEVKQEIKKL